jgi:hypothetical protein
MNPSKSFGCLFAIPARTLMGVYEPVGPKANRAPNAPGTWGNRGTVRNQEGRWK